MPRAGGISIAETRWRAAGAEDMSWLRGMKPCSEWCIFKDSFVGVPRVTGVLGAESDWLRGPIKAR